MSPKIAKVVVGLPVEGPFDYFIPEGWRANAAIGQRVSVLFNRRRMTGFIVDLQQTSHFKKLNSILSFLDGYPSLDEKALQLTKLISEHYGCSWGEAIEVYLPPVLRRSGKTQLSLFDNNLPLSEKDVCNVLVHDASKEQKWELLRDKIRKVEQAKKNIIILVPELIVGKEIISKLGREDILILEKKLPVKQEMAQWIKMKEGNVSIVIGTRSAIFAPVPNLGLIVIYDEEHDFYKEEQSPYYDARYVAQMRSKLEQCPVVFISAAPSAETWKEAQKKNWEVITLEGTQTSKVQVVDMSNYNPQKTSILSFPLQNHIRLFLEEKKKVVLFMNRRGFAGITRCNQCGFTIKCERCDVNLTYLQSKNYMICRQCDFTRDLPSVCPDCKGNYLRSMGKGIEKLKQEASRIFPGAIVANYDKDNPDFPTYANIIIATQTILKVKDKKVFDLIAILNFDSELHHMDYRCAQKTFTLLIHLRNMTKEKLMVQTYMTDNYVLKSVQKMDFGAFYREELQHRKDLGFPPYRHLVVVRFRGLKEEEVLKQSLLVFEQLNETKPKDIDMTDPHPDGKPKLRDKYRFSILLTGKAVKPILALTQKVLKEVKKKRNIIVTTEVEY